MKNKPLQDLLSQIRISFLGENLMKKYADEKSPLRSELFSTEQLEQYAKTLAAGHKVSTGQTPDKLLKRLAENEEMLLEVHDLITESAKENRLIAPAGEWLLDNFYLVQEHISTGKKHLPKGYSEILPQLVTGVSEGLPRVYDIAIEIISHSDGRVDMKSLSNFITAYQTVSHLKLGELWAIPIMLRLALIENLRRLSVQLAIDRINKNLADYWADRMTETAEKDPKSLIVVTADMARSDPPMVSSFVAELTRRLLGKGPALAIPLTWIEQRLAENGLTSNGLVHSENQKQAADQLSISNSIGSLRFLSTTDWREFVEMTSVVEQTLREDIDGIYGKMDFYTRDHYRHIVEKIARYGSLSEEEVARTAIEMAKKCKEINSEYSCEEHVGFFLAGKGLKQIEKFANARFSRIESFRKFAGNFPLLLYIGTSILLTLILSAALVFKAKGEGLDTGWIIIAAVLSLICTSHFSVSFVNWLTTVLITPHFLPRMDFSSGIPLESRTLVVVPTLLSNDTELDSILEPLEARFLANKDENLHFALLTDFRDAPSETLPEDEPLLESAKARICELNKKYGSNKNGIFFLFHRPRRWNAADKIWMGYERKRGKLSELNALLRGRAKDRFLLIVGDEEVYLKVKYVITLDTDTQLPRDAARKITATISHPLNRAFYDEKKKRVTEGYGILQPRLATTLPEAEGSLYARMHGNEPGIDPYTRAVSDVYQDLMQEGSFIGKGIYEIDAFELALGSRFPENRILSHDLLEGCYARSGLISDVQLYEKYPSGYLADMKRRHRWIRGDWQIARWLFPYVPDSDKRSQKNPLSTLSCWKIFDNLRRSLVPPALIFLLLFGWLISPAPWFWTLTVAGIIICVSLLILGWDVYKKPDDVLLADHAKASFKTVANNFIQHLFMFICLPYEAFINLDAIVRTNWRMFISHKKLLDWDPSANEHDNNQKKLYLAYLSMWIGPFLGIVIFIYLLIYSETTLIIAYPVLILWIISPFIAWWVSLSLNKRKAKLTQQQNIFLHTLARKTWGFFENFVTQDENWLPPDNYQEYLVKKIAHRTSPTNIGLSLLANLSAYDFGFITACQLIDRTTQTTKTMETMERYRGHFFNWYDTLSLAPLFPKYISTVDSGNLAAHLLTLKQGLLSLSNQKIFETRFFEGLRDTLRVLAEKIEETNTLKELHDQLEAACTSQPATLESIKLALEQLTSLSSEILSHFNLNAESETYHWANSLFLQCRKADEELIDLAPWLLLTAIPVKFNQIASVLLPIPTFVELSRMDVDILPEINHHYAIDNTIEENEWLNDLSKYLTKGSQKARERILHIEQLAQQCDDFSNIDYDFLYDKPQNLLSIGYNVEEQRRDAGFYDLLGSESRLAVFVAISQGKIPQESWFALGRQLTNHGTDPVLLSWSGSMFEYLMPLLVMPDYENTLLNQTYKASVQRQIEYGRTHGLYWGISESGYNMVDTQLSYQYRAFGVPGLGLKRGLADDFVIAPYASIMALMVQPEEACKNLEDLAKDNFEGNYGFYEAIDYTPARIPRGQSNSVVQSFMAHHQGISLLSLEYYLLDQLMQKRFESEPRFQATLLLLQERIPRVNIFFSPTSELAEISTPLSDMQMRVISSPNTPAPEVQLLSNGRYHVMLTNSGGGYSRWNDMAVTRWREDTTCDNWGIFCFIRDLESNSFWSSAHQPTLRQTDFYEVIFSQGRAEFRRRDNNIETHTEIVVSPEDDVEIRRSHITNRSRRRRTIEITSYAEVVLASAISDTLHPAFSNLFVQTEIISQRQAILCTRRPRFAGEHPLWMFHLMKVHEGDIQNISYETNRDQFIGRGNIISDPQVMRNSEPLSGNEGSVLDPIVSIQYRITLNPQESVTVDLVYGIGTTHDACNGLIEKYQDRHMLDRAFELAWTHSQVVLRQINATEADSQLYGRLAGSVIFANPSLRADPGILIKNNRGQSGLWSHSVSGDLPIVLLQIEDSANIELVKQVVQAHAYWRLKGLAVDLVIWNEDFGGYRQILQNQILALIAPGIATDIQDRPGAIFVRTADQISNEDRILFQSVARIIVSDKLGTLEGQINRRRRLKGTVTNFMPVKFYPILETTILLPKDLQFFNGTGGFSQDGKEYVIIMSPNQVTPAPWVNVLANPNFGTVISESGQSYTWLENAHEFRLTPWNNDPVSDSGGENFYLRDEESGRYWSLAPLPCRGKSTYITRHGFGYSVFEHTEDGIHSEMWVYVDTKESVKFTVIKLHNQSGRPRRLTATGYAEWVLGDVRSKTTMHIVTELDINTGAIFAKNPYNTEFRHRVAFFDTDEAAKTITTDRAEFIGRNGTLKNPDAMSRSKLSGKTGAALDPCAVIQVNLALAENEVREIRFRIGAGKDADEASHLVIQFRGKLVAREVLDNVRKYWQRTLSAIQVETPDVSLNILTNGWLNYQTLASRLWGRSGFYQSGGAFGFRDQLQDVLSIIHTEPSLVRNQILLCASRQFTEGDVQHWWHPPGGRGVRTHCSDDFLWLPFVTCRYIETTGDISILDERVHFLDGRLLNPGEDSYYDRSNRSDQSATLYNHCVRAIENGLWFGTHGLPLIGTGDWNDGMDKIGDKGKGESVWLGFFLSDVLKRFSEVASLRNDLNFVDKCKEQENRLKVNLEKNGWDGEWYRRAYFDDGSPLGSSVNTECKIDSIAQSWSVLSGAGDPEHSQMAMESANKLLTRREDSIIQLLDPPFDKSDLNPGYIKGYVPGVRENGGQYTHAAIWLTMAFAALDDKKRAWELLKIINPVNHGTTSDEIGIYKVEPYVIAADVYAIAQQKGRGGWTWYTGSAGWMYQLLVESLLGLKREASTLHFKPCLPPEWSNVKMKYRFGETIYSILFEQDESINEQIAVYLNDVRQKNNSISLVDDGQPYSVKIVLGNSVK